MASSPNQKIESIISDIEKYSDPFDRAGIDRACKKMAKETLKALNDSTHQLSIKYDDLKTVIKPRKLKSSAFVHPSPTNADQVIKAFWPLQFLLHLTGLEPTTQAGLAAHVGLSSSNLKTACDAVPRDLSAEDPNKARLTKRLAKAAQWLRWPDAETPFRIENRDLIFDAGPTIKLSIQESTLLETLMDHPDEAVSHADLMAVGVKQPTKRLSDLNKKLSKHPEVAVNISAYKGTLTLRS